MFKKDCVYPPVVFLVLLLLIPLHLYAQATTDEANAGPQGSRLSTGERVLLAISSPEYPATPGDTFRLTYSLPSGSMRDIRITVDAQYRLSLGAIGSISVEGLTLPEITELVSARLKETYPMSYPMFTLEQVGLFHVYIAGAVEESQWVDAWGLSRLSTVLEGRTLPYSSTRSILVVRADGRRETYDLFAAQRFGEGMEDPLLRPGDRIQVPEADRRVSVSGEVLRPGSYELLEDENISDLLERVAVGTTSEANLREVKISSIDHDAEDEIRYKVREYDITRQTLPQLQHRDAVYVPSIREQNPVAYVLINSADGPVRIRHRLRRGDTLLRVLRSVFVQRTAQPVDVNQISPGNLALARLIRANGNTQVINLERLLFQNAFELDMQLRPGDTIVIP